MRTESVYINLINDIIKIAKNAGVAILEVYKDSNIQADLKDDNSPLTLADKASNEIITKKLKKLTPEIPILSEEGKKIDYSERKKWKLFWLIDPLDGTKEFIKKNGEFTVNIALISNGQPILGIVYAPVLNILWHGNIKDGSYKTDSNNSSVKLNVKKPNGTIKVVASRSHSNNPKLDNFLIKYPDYKLVKMGSSIKICLVADGSADIYPRLGPTMEWDTAAAHAVVKFAGGNIYDLDNMNELTYNKSNLLNPEFLVNHL